jgi:hypothetical protein
MVVLPAAPGQEGQVLEVGDRWEGFRVEEVTTTEMVLAKQEGGQVVRKVLRLQVGGARRPKGTDRGSGDGAPAIPQKRVTLPYVGEKALVDAARRCFALGETTMRVVTLGGLTVPTPRGWEEQPEARAAALQEACSLAETASKDETTGCRAAYALRLAAFLDPSSETFESLRWHIRQVLASARIFGVRSAAEGAPVYLDPVERVTHFVSSFSDSRLGDRIGELAREIGQEALSFPPTPEELKARPK